MQNAILREMNATVKKEVEVVEDNGRKIHVQMWNSPNMKQRTKPKKDPPAPPDMGSIKGYIDKIKEHAGYLSSCPALRASWMGASQSAEPDLIIRGAVSSAQALPRTARPGGPKPKDAAAETVGETHLIHRASEPPVVVVASAIQQAFANFLAEILKLPECARDHPQQNSRHRCVR